MAKTPALSTQLKTAQARIVELEKQLESQKNSVKYVTDARDEYRNEVEQIHAFLDAVPNTIPRDTGDYSLPKRTAITRLAAWLAVR